MMRSKWFAIGLNMIRSLCLGPFCTIGAWTLSRLAPIAGTGTITNGTRRGCITYCSSRNRMNIDRRLRIDFTWVLAGNIIYSACQWIIVVVLAKLGNPEQVGEYALGVAISAPILLFANLQLRSLLASDVEDRFPFSHYFTFRLLSLAAALMVVAAAAALTAGNTHQAGVIILVGAIQALELVSETYYGFMQRQSRMDRMARSLILRAPLSLTAMGIVMYFTRNIVLALIA